MIAAPQQTVANRATRRRQTAKVNRFRRRCGLALDTTLIAAGTPLNAHGRAGLYRAAIADAYRDPGALRCIVCGLPFATERPFGAFLLASAVVKPSTASLAALCSPCWADAPSSEIEAQAERVLRKIVPGGAFLDPLEMQP